MSLACGKGQPFDEECGEQQGVGKRQERPRTRDVTPETGTSRKVSSGASAMSCDSPILFDD